jgi:sugar diacid utilization regulator
VERERAIHRNLYGVTLYGAGELGIAKALHTITGLPAAIEDRFGNLRAWAGPGRPDPYPKPRAQQRRELLREVTRRGPVARVKDRLVAVAHTRDDRMLGVLALVDRASTAGRHETLALEYAAAILAGELTHQHDLIKLEQRLRADLVQDLLTGTEADSGYARSRAIDHDLHSPHHVVAIRWDGPTNGELTRAAEHAAAGLGFTSLVATRDGMTVLLTKGQPDGRELHDALARRLRSASGSIGVGGRCESPEEFPRSFKEAVLALDIRLTSRAPHGATSFDELGVIRVLDTGDGGAKIRLFVRDWLGPLLDYDTRNHSHLVHTLSQHLDCGGSYDDTAAALVIHRSTLRYRLQRIREISGLDLADAGNRLNLHVATRAWRILDDSS